MNGSIAAIVTMGFGTFGSVNLVVTVGYGSSAQTNPVYGPLMFHAAKVYQPGAKAADIYRPGAKAGTVQ